MPVEIDCTQRDDLWRACRLGIPTASSFAKILTPTGKLSTQRDAYIHQLLAEWVLGYEDEIPQTYWIERGANLEPEARNWYEFQHGVDVRQVGFVYTDERRLSGCSPDWLIGEDGGGEIKCPKASTHIGYLLAETIPKDYIPQVQGCLYVTGRAWWDFVSYHPELPPKVIRVERDPEYQQALEQALGRFELGLYEGRERLLKLGIEPKPPVYENPADFCPSCGAKKAKAPPEVCQQPDQHPLPPHNIPA